MNILQQAFKLLDNFSNQSPSSQKATISKMDKFLKSSENGVRNAQLALREFDQLRKQRAHMLVLAGRAEEGIKEMQSLIAQYETLITELHEEAAFQSAEAAMTAYQLGRASAGKAFARSALKNAGMSQSISRIVLSAIEMMQRQQEAESRRMQSKRKAT